MAPLIKTPIGQQDTGHPKTPNRPGGGANRNSVYGNAINTGGRTRADLRGLVGTARLVVGAIEYLCSNMGSMGATGHIPIRK